MKHVVVRGMSKSMTMNDDKKDIFLEVPGTRSGLLLNKKNEIYFGASTRYRGLGGSKGNVLLHAFYTWICYYF